VEREELKSKNRYTQKYIGKQFGGLLKKKREVTVGRNYRKGRS